MERTIRLGVVQPRTWYGDEEPRNLDDALDYVGQAAALHVHLLVFPENYPGPYTGGNRFEVVDPLREAAARHGVGIAAGTSVETAPGSGRYRVAIVLIAADGALAGTYLRTHPAGPYLYPGGDLWDFDYEAADELPVFDMGWGKVGAIVCSEVFVPELARGLALKGAELCLMPAGLLIDELGYTDNWQALVRARAIENLMYTATTVNLFPPEFARRYMQADVELPRSGSGLTGGIAMIASPERVLASSTAPGIVTADLDLDRIRWLRETEEELIVPAPYGTIPGILGWRRPEVFATVREKAPEPGESAAATSPATQTGGPW